MQHILEYRFRYTQLLTSVFIDLFLTAVLHLRPHLNCPLHSHPTAELHASKSFPCSRHNSTKGSRCIAPTFLNCTLNGVQSSVSSSTCFTPGEKTQVTNEQDSERSAELVCITELHCISFDSKVYSGIRSTASKKAEHVNSKWQGFKLETPAKNHKKARLNAVWLPLQRQSPTDYV